MVRDMGRELWCIIMGESMKETGNVITSMGKDMRSLLDSVSTREIMLTEDLKVWAGIAGPMGNFTKDNGLME
jgi:hypothetical protein